MPNRFVRHKLTHGTDNVFYFLAPENHYNNFADKTKTGCEPADEADIDEPLITVQSLLQSKYAVRRKASIKVGTKRRVVSFVIAADKAATFDASAAGAAYTTFSSGAGTLISVGEPLKATFS